MRRLFIGRFPVFVLYMGLCAGAAFGQIVRIAPIIKQTPTPLGSERFAGTVPPDSDALVDPGSTFYIEIWATNANSPLYGLACVHVDLFYSDTTLVDSIPPAEDSGLFTINAVTPVFNDALRFIDDLGGCQPAPALVLGVDEWVMVERVEMYAVVAGGPVDITLSDAANIFAGTSLIGQINNLDPADIEFQARSFHIGGCLVDGDCDDLVGCTIDTCVSLACSNTPDDALCDDGLWCNGAETCDALLDCQAGTAPNCDDSVACTVDACDEVNDVCTNTADDALCDDGLWCNGAETCDPLLDCQAGTAPDCDDLVGCTVDACDEVNDICTNTPNDALCDDGQLCNGAETCDAVLDCQSGTPPTCDDGVGCTNDFCDPAGNGGAGACVNTAIDALCDDGLWCNGPETCDAFLDCQTGTPPDCDDSVGCTDDSCNEATDSCDNIANDANCDNGLWCDGAETCDPLLDCQPGTAPDCDDSVGCTDDSCNEATDSCDNIANDANCDNGLWCDGAETCDPLLDCQAGTAPDCDDLVGCTVDECDDVNDTCTNTPDDALCDDGQLCNGAETCDAVLDCQPGTPPTCDDGVGCTNDSCDSTANQGAGGCVNDPDDANCDDLLFCNGAETCDPVSDCQPGTDPCDDNVACTVDDCDEENDNCTNTPDDTFCDNTLFCDGAEWCDPDLGCQPGTNPCDDGVGCTDDICDEGADLCGHDPMDAWCENPLYCDGAEWCDPDLDCQPGTYPCDDGVGCTNDICDEVHNSCEYQPDDTLCDDGVWCNGTETCDQTLDCQPGTSPCVDPTPGCDESTHQCFVCFCPSGSSCLNPDCDDGVGCTDDYCQFLFDAWQCLHVEVDANCDDALECNGIETCDRNDDCQPGVPACPTAEEPLLTACIETVDGPVCVECVEPEDCDDGVYCNGAEQCVDNVCALGPDPCDDGVGCTADVCDEDGDYCQNNRDDTRCDDGQYCNGAETCHRTLDCLPGTPPCTDPDYPICSESTDTCVECLTDYHCDDDLFCTGVETCVATVCQPGTPPCNDGFDCTVDSCNESTDQCTNAPADLLCDDSVACTVNTCDPTDPTADASGCVFTPNSVACDDTFACTLDVCDPGDPAAGADGCVITPTDAQCDDLIGCTLDVCDPGDPGADANGCTFTSDDTVCEDDLFCNGAEWCHPLLDCQPGTDPCTDPLRPHCNENDDVCAECLGDWHCDDGLFCNGAETCTGGVCTTGTNPCNDGVDCTIDTCNEATGCSNVPEDLLCDDGLFCTGPETCDPLLDCVQGAAPCDDGVDCTVDNCDEANDACGAHVADDAFCADEFWCNGAETCDPVSDCQIGSPPCTDPSQPVCDEAGDRCVGCLDTDYCDDDLFCNGAETCVDNVCQPGAPPCDDQVECTLDDCDEAADSCTNTPLDSFCDDGLFCNGAETCDPAAGCQLGVDPCEDHNPCSADICDEGFNTCSHDEYAYGNVDRNRNPEGEDVINLFDIFCILEGIAGDFSRCTLEQDDVHPCGGNGELNVLDVFAVLDALEGIDPCCSNGIGACCTGANSCFAVEANVAAECTNLGGVYFGDGTDCFTDSDYDGILDVHETDTGFLDLPCSTGTDPNNPDTDGDGVLDGDEVYGDEGMDLPGMGANPFRYDIFVEIDWTDFGAVSHEPSPPAIAAVQAAFAAAPVTSLDGSSGIALHIDYGQGGPYTGGQLISGAWSFITFEGGFNGFKSTYLDRNRRGVFHYGIFTHRYDSDDNTRTGVAEIGEDDFMVTLQDAVTDAYQAGTLMRMLGHNMGLRCGGLDELDFKPNYNSVVNSRYQLDGIDVDCDAVPDGVLDFSDGSRIPLNEMALNEFAGVCGDTPINWNGGNYSQSVSQNINCPAGMTFACGLGEDVCGDRFCTTVLLDLDDWANIVIDTMLKTDTSGELGYGAKIPE